MDNKSLKIIDKNLEKKNSKLPVWVKRKLNYQSDAPIFLAYRL